MRSAPPRRRLRPTPPRPSAQGTRYTGQWVDGRRCGRGTLLYPDGTSYDGGWRDDRKHGSGKWTDRGAYEGEGCGDAYEGEYASGVREGDGRWVGGSGDAYEGGFISGAMGGAGRFSWRVKQGDEAEARDGS